MDKNDNPPSTQPDPILPDSRLRGSQNEIRPDTNIGSPILPDPIPLDPRLTYMLEKAQKPDIIAADPRLTSQVIENGLKGQHRLITEDVQNQSTQNQSKKDE